MKSDNALQMVWIVLEQVPKRSRLDINGFQDHPVKIEHNGFQHTFPTGHGSVSAPDNPQPA
jgi:hypothetical protein